LPGPEGAALLDEVRASLVTLSSLLAHNDSLGPEVMAAVGATLQYAENKLSRQDLSVVVVGEKGAGATTFLDALLGDRVLGSAARGRRCITFIRSGPAAGYRARFAARGNVEDFDERFPDRTEELTAKVASAEAALAQAIAEQERVTAEVGKKSQVQQSAQSELKDRFRVFEEARDRAATVGRELADAEGTYGQLDGARVEGEERLPLVVRTPPPSWAVWLWIARGVLLLFHLARWRAHLEIVRQLDELRARISSLRAASGKASEACMRAQAHLEPASSPADIARAAVKDVRVRMADSEAKVEQARGELTAARTTLEQEHDSRRRRFLEEVQTLFDPNGRGKDVVQLDITYPARFIPQDVTIIDAPGLTATDAAANERDWQVVRDEADGCMLVSELRRAVSGPTRAFLKRVRELVPHVILVLTKMDVAFTEAMRKGGAEPWEHVEHARRIGTRRFARELGREPETVLSVAVAAEPSLRTGERGGLARRFESEVAKLFRLLRQERALILGSRCARQVRQCIGSAAQAEERAERGYQDRLAALEQNRIPDPEHFRAQQLEAAEPDIVDAASGVVESALKALQGAIGVVRVGCAARIEACKSRDALRAVVPQLEQLLAEGCGQMQQELSRHVAAQAEAGVRKIEANVFESLRKRYEIAHQVTRASNPSLHFEADPTSTGGAALAPGVDRAVRTYTNLRVGLGAGGAVAGAAVGTLIMPGLGTAAGAAIGALLTFARTQSALRRDCMQLVEARLTAVERTLAAQLSASHAEIAGSIRTAVDRSVAKAMVRFGRWIAEPIEAERAAIENQRAKLLDLQSVRERLQQHDQQLASLVKAATDASLGLCR
jgi:hypothetical protein